MVGPRFTGIRRTTGLPTLRRQDRRYKRDDSWNLPRKSAVPRGAASSLANLLDYFLQGRGHCGAICWWAQRCCWEQWQATRAVMLASHRWPQRWFGPLPVWLLPWLGGDQPHNQSLPRRRHDGRPRVLLLRQPRRLQCSLWRSPLLQLWPAIQLGIKRIIESS